MGSINYCVNSPGTCAENRCHICPLGYEPAGPVQLPLFSHDPEYPQQKHKSDLGSTEYYKFQEGETDLSDVIERIGMPFSRANIFKACMRLGQKAGTDIMYDLNKMEFFIKRMKDAYIKGYKV